jgi:hypothetical protein
MDALIGLIIGLILGGCLGAVLMACCIVAAAAGKGVNDVANT